MIIALITMPSVFWLFSLYPDVSFIIPGPVELPAKSL